MRLPLTFLLCGAAALTVLAQDGPPQRPNFIRFHPLLSALDADGDGVVSSKELAGAPAALAKLDANKDGQITPEEMRPQFGGPGGPGGPGGGRGGREGGGPGGPGEARPPQSAELVKTLMAFDENGDGKLQKSEVPERMQGLFARADANKDGVLTQDELTKVAEAQGQGPAAGGGPGRGGEGRGEGGERRGGPGGPGGPGGGMRMDLVMTALDTDKDGVVSAAEIQVSAASLKTLDKNGDGQITEDEVRPNFGGGRGPGRPEGRR